MASFDITPETTKVIKAMAERKGCTADEAAEYLITKGVQKWNAEHKWIKNNAQPKAKKAPKAKAAKAKGPLARKAKTAPAKKVRKAKAPKAEGGAEALAL